MILNVVIGENTIPVEVPDFVVQEGGDYFARLDADMNEGRLVGRDWVDDLNQEQRCQVVADRLLTALETENEKMSLMMAGYILNRVPGIKGVRVAINGEIQETELLMHESDF